MASEGTNGRDDHELTPAQADAQPLTPAERDAVPGGTPEVLADALEDAADTGEDDHPERDDLAVPRPLRVGAAWSWRLIVIGIVLVTLGNVLALLGPIVLPLIIALLVAAPLERVVTSLQRLHIPRGIGAIAVVLALVAAMLGLSYAVGASVISGFDQLKDSAADGFDTLVAWLTDGPLHVSSEQIDAAVEEVSVYVRDNAWGLASGAIDVTGTLSALLAGVILALLALFFFLRDGGQMWQFFVSIAPRGARRGMDRAGRAGWTTLSRYTQTSVVVALIDALGIGIGAWILGVPLALPIGITVFLLSFIPMFGATISGLVAVLVALVDGGWVTALIMLGVVLVVQQVEGNVLYPMLFGKAAQVHPMAIMISVSAGTLLAGVAGAVIAVPIVAFCVAAGRGLHREYIATRDNAHPMTAQIPVLAERSRKALRGMRERVTTGTIRVRRRR